MILAAALAVGQGTPSLAEDVERLGRNESSDYAEFVRVKSGGKAAARLVLNAMRVKPERNRADRLDQVFTEIAEPSFFVEHFRLVAHWGNYYNNRAVLRGPDLYRTLLRLAYDPELPVRKRAWQFLLTTAASERGWTRSKPRLKPGDPALIRLFRCVLKDPNSGWANGAVLALGYLDDRESLPEIRRILQVRPRSPQLDAAMSALWLMDDREAGVHVVPWIKLESRKNLAPDKVGDAARNLRRTGGPEVVPMLLELIRTEPGDVRADALNALGYLGDSSHLEQIEAYRADPHARTAAAANNAQRRIRGELSRTPFP